MNGDDRDAILIDGLVEGELDPDARRRLLERLDASPDGWRRCALAFLEAQAWREALGPATPASQPPPRVHRPAWRLPRLAAPALAAGLLVGTFALGWSSRGVTSGPASPTIALRGPDPTPAREVATSPPAPPHATPPPAGRPAPTAPRPAPAIPDQIRRDWAIRGIEVERRRRLIAVGLKDGRRVPVPVDEWTLRDVGGMAY